MRNFKNYFLVVFTLLNVSFYSLKAEEDTCSIQLKKTEIELLEPLTLQITYKDIGEKKSSSLEYHILIEEVVNEGEEGLKKVISGHRIAPIAYWSEQGRIKERVLVFYDFRKKRVIFEKAGTYKIQVNAWGNLSNELQIQVNLGLLNLEQMDPILKQKLLSTEFLKLMYLPEEKNVTGVQYAYELMAQYPQSALARYAKNYVAIANYSDFLTFAERNDNAPPFLQYAAELKAVLKDNPVKGHYLTRLTKYLRGHAFYYGRKFEKSRDILTKLLKRPDEVRLKAINRLSYVLEALEVQNPGSSPLDAQTLHEMMVINSQQYLDSEEDSEEDEDD